MAVSFKTNLYDSTAAIKSVALIAGPGMTETSGEIYIRVSLRRERICKGSVCFSFVVAADSNLAYLVAKLLRYVRFVGAWPFLFTDPVTIWLFASRPLAAGLGCLLLDTVTSFKNRTVYR